MTVKQCIKKHGWIFDCEASCFYRAMIVHVGFINSNGREDEVSFDIKSFDVDSLDELYSEFCKENNQKRNTIATISIVAVAETMEKLKEIDL